MSSPPRIRVRSARDRAASATAAVSAPDAAWRAAAIAARPSPTLADLESTTSIGTSVIERAASSAEDIVAESFEVKQMTTIPVAPSAITLR
ncbi:unannotated protein [freshwater metagenome]|uniref:Unannotated protein n=1 Tax=freshwater metagenome TaxID=449393 RepID=A0A6J7MZJ8_9ZZZZ